MAGTPPYQSLVPPPTNHWYPPLPIIGRGIFW
nr:MAG TPA: hypothetical protein [Caudoviricetes sp.]